MGGISKGTFLGKHAWEMVLQGCQWENMSRKKIPRKQACKKGLKESSQEIISLLFICFDFIAFGLSQDCLVYGHFHVQACFKKSIVFFCFLHIC
jgi:hypothetical protein